MNAQLVFILALEEQPLTLLVHTTVLKVNGLNPGVSVGIEQFLYKRLTIQ